MAVDRAGEDICDGTVLLVLEIKSKSESAMVGDFIEIYGFGRELRSLAALSGFIRFNGPINGVKL